MSKARSRVAAAFYFLVAAPVGIAMLVALPQHATPKPAANEIVLGVDPAQSKVHWVLDTSLHTVHGTFVFKNGTLRVDPASGKAGGEIVVLANSGESGNDGRDKKMHKDVLESAQYPDVVFKPDRVEGKITTKENCSVQVHGIFVLHGAEHEITIPVQAQFAGDRWSGSAKFSVPFIEWGLKNPSNFLLKVNHSVSVELDLKGTLQNPSAQ
jgi:polyisoprenoid-binding protein YceI